MDAGRGWDGSIARLRGDVIRGVRDQDESGYFDRLDKSWYCAEDMRSAHESHEVVTLGNPHCFFDGHDGLAIARHPIDVVMLRSMRSSPTKIVA